MGVEGKKALMTFLDEFSLWDASMVWDSGSDPKVELGSRTFMGNRLDALRYMMDAQYHCAVDCGRRFGKTAASRKMMEEMAGDNYIYTSSTGTGSTSNYNYTVTYDPWKTEKYFDPYKYSYQPFTVQSWMGIDPATKESKHMEKCKYCDEDLISIHTEEEREFVKNDDDGKPVYKWTRYTVKEFDCGTIIRSGDIPDGLRRATIGGFCIEFAD